MSSLRKEEATTQDGRSVIVPFAGTKHTATEAERRAITRVREISRNAKLVPQRSA